MDINSLIINMHLVPFKMLIIIGIVLLIAAPLSYMNRTKTPIYSIFDLLKYSNIEKKILLLGVIIIIVGMMGQSHMKDKHGYNVRVTDEHGNVTIENSKKW